MSFDGDDFKDYPGHGVAALKEDFEQLRFFASRLGIRVTTESGASYYLAERKLINIDAKTATPRGFVSVGVLTDEYVHAWNTTAGRGRYLANDARSEHQRLGRLAERHGTKPFVAAENRVFHKLEALNFVLSDVHVPSFCWRVPYIDLRRFAHSWRRDYE